MSKYARSDTKIKIFGKLGTRAFERTLRQLHNSKTRNPNVCASGHKIYPFPTFTVVNYCRFGDHRNFQNFSTSAGDILGTKCHMTKQKNELLRNILFYRPPKNYNGWIRCQIDEILKNPYPPISGFWSPIL